MFPLPLLARHGLLGDHGRLYYALPRRREMLAALHDLRAVHGSEGVVVLAELGASCSSRATLLPALKHGGTARVLGHGSNCC